jgi:WhiB family redox-sensing transcriptional regulator
VPFHQFRLPHTEMPTVATTTIISPLDTTARSIALSHPQPAGRKARPSDATLNTELRPPCQVSTVDLWFSETPHEVQQAKQLCGGCPIRVKCLAGALHRREPWGVWGGKILHRGTIVAHQPTRRRPRIDTPRAERTPLAAPPRSRASGSLRLRDAHSST